jgi:protein required for attachment to host cells
MLTKGAIDLVIKEIKKDLTGSDEQNLKNYIWE